MTGSRIKEVIIADKNEVDGNLWHRPGPHMKNRLPHTLPLTAITKALFAECAAASSNGQFFSGRTGSGRETFDPKGCSRATTILMQELGIDASAHDFRRTIATRLSELNTHADIIPAVKNPGRWYH